MVLGSPISMTYEAMVLGYLISMTYETSQPVTESKQLHNFPVKLRVQQTSTGEVTIMVNKVLRMLENVMGKKQLR